MLKVRDLMQTDVITVAPSLSLRDLVDLLAQHHISGAPVVEAGRLSGVISSDDVTSFLSSTPGVPTEQTDFLEEGETTAPGEWEEGDESPTAYYTELWDDAGADVRERMERVTGPEWDILAEHTVSEAMTRALAVVSPDADVMEAARHFTQRRIHRVLVLEDGRLLGILTTSDLVRAVADGRFTEATAGKAPVR